MNVLLRSSRCLLRRIAPQGHQLPSQITEECRPRSAEAAALLTYCMHRDSSIAPPNTAAVLVGSLTGTFESGCDDIDLAVLFSVLGHASALEK